MIPPTATFNEKAREIQGDRMLTQRQEAMARIVDNRTPQYQAAKREHEEPVARIEDTRELWPERLSEVRSDGSGTSVARGFGRRLAGFPRHG